MSHHDLTGESPLSVSDAMSTLSTLPASALSLRLSLIECTTDLLSLIATRFADLTELTIQLRDYNHPFGDVVVSADDFATKGTVGLGTTRALAVTVGKTVGVRIFLFQTFRKLTGRLCRLATPLSSPH